MFVCVSWDTPNFGAFLFSLKIVQEKKDNEVTVVPLTFSMLNMLTNPLLLPPLILQD